MAYSTEEIREHILGEITRFCPKEKRRGVWVNTVKKRGRISEELTDHIERKRHDGSDKGV